MNRLQVNSCFNFPPPVSEVKLIAVIAALFRLISYFWKLPVHQLDNVRFVFFFLREGCLAGINCCFQCLLLDSLAVWLCYFYRLL